ncbi:MFS transporter [Sphingomonas jatrophae]|uniref:Sugar phosphate permease n=1 Tax=Sphingomonas jatrophae TaxID=1166337 RepID=A0A1I6M009_9SPHN|nr:MFS transporter [Sphingomonas jatrophae]SFS09030.1 Sugar phosphate permease [Sphingomonas jatrophae]
MTEVGNLRGARRQVCLAALAQNVATGLTFGTFGTLVLAIERDLGMSRTASALTMSAMVLTLSLVAAALGRLLERYSLRATMLSGSLAGICGFFVLSLVKEPALLVVIYALVLGPATAMLGVLPSNTLATRWAPAEWRGRALGLVNTPVLVMVAPLAAGWMLSNYGLRATFLTLALAQLCITPFFLAVRDGDEGQLASPDPTQSTLKHPAILSRPAFWIMIVATGLIVGAGTMKIAHLVPLLTEQKRTFAEANLLLALSGGAGLLGSLTFGTLADRFGAAPALIANALLQAGMWTIFLAPVGLGWLIADAVVVGACGGGVQSAFGVLLSNLFGREAFGRAFGLASLFTLPFLFGLSPLAGLLRERTGDYHLPIGVIVGGFIVAGLLLAALVRSERHGRSLIIQRRHEDA